MVHLEDKVTAGENENDESASEFDALCDAGADNQEVLGSLLAKHRDGLRHLVRFRMDRRLRTRVDPSDVIQETFLDAAKRLDDYLQKPGIPFRIWLRLLTSQKIAEVHRRHLGVKARDAGREVSIDAEFAQSSVLLAAKLAGQFSSPSRRMMQDELRQRLVRALDELSEMDREILMLTHFEQLTIKEAGQVLGYKHSAACNRYARALTKLKDALE